MPHEHIIYRTNPRWLKNIRGLPQNTQLNFWRSPTRQMRLQEGSMFYFRPNSSEFVEGGAKFVTLSRRNLLDAWEEWGCGNGASSVEELRAMIREVLKLDEDNPVIGCAILTAPFFFAKPCPLIPPALRPPAQEPKKYFTYDDWPDIEYAKTETVA